MSDDDGARLYVLPPTPEPQSLDAWREHDPLFELAKVHAEIMRRVPRRHRREVTDLLRDYARVYDECVSLTTRWEEDE